MFPGIRNLRKEILPPSTSHSQFRSNRINMSKKNIGKGILGGAIVYIGATILDSIFG
jgi:hypothetical protein